MVVAIRIALYVISGALFLGALSFFGRALSARAMAGKQAYGVARQAERLRMMQASFWGVGLLILALIFVAVAGLSTLAADADTSVTADPTAEVVVEIVATPAPVLTATLTLATPPPAPTIAPTTPPAVVTQLPTPALVPTLALSPTVAVSPTVGAAVPPTVSAGANTAVVNSPVVGLYIRVSPGGEIVERLEDQVEVILLGESQQVDGVQWVTVLATSGNQGWVAAEYLQFTTPPAGSDGG